MQSERDRVPAEPREQRPLMILQGARAIARGIDAGAWLTRGSTAIR